ncbi:MAG TPA: hypothetical protein VHU84_04045 [Lacipirellulaceae bacterium]|jgi:hypothetical protein|nr:hypothetical protein [Lacipirellulaceae bacterium]
MFDEHEPAEPELTPDLKAIEGKLARLLPASARVDRDRLMFEAGRAAARPERPGYIAEPSRLGGRMWPAATMLMTAASLLLAVSLVWQRRSFEVALQERPQAVSVGQVAEPRPVEAVSAKARQDLATEAWMALGQPANGYLGIRYAALTRGVNSIETGPSNLGVADPAGELDQTQRDILNELLPSAKNKKHSRS